MKIIRSGRWLSLLFTLVVSSSAIAGMLDNWHWVNPTPYSDTMESICFAAGKFVAVGQNGLIHVSLDGQTWNSGKHLGTHGLNRVIYADGQFIAVGDAGTIFTSTDGLTWQSQLSGTTSNLFAVAFGNGRFIACGTGGQVVISTNGVNWVTGTDGTSDLTWITFGNGVFVASAPGMAVSVSTDGQLWADFVLPTFGNKWPQAVFQAEFGNGAFIAAGAADSDSGLGSTPASFFYRSTDGTNWTQGPLLPYGPRVTGAFKHRFLSFLNGTFQEMTAYYELPYSPNPISLTSDGSSFTTTYGPTNASSAHEMAYGNDWYVLIADNGLTWTSTDETNWLSWSGGFQNSVSSIAEGESTFLLFANSLPIFVSSDGSTFSAATNSPSGVLTQAIFDGTNFVAVGGTANPGLPRTYTGEVYTSTNGTDWVRRTSNANQPLAAICRSPSRWIAVGGAGTVITSPNTLAWTLRSPGTANNLTGVAYGNGTYVAVGDVGTIITSMDGTSWDVQFSGTTSDLKQLQFTNGQFTAVGADGTILTSGDGMSWSSQDSGTTATLTGIAYGGGYYFACGTLNGSGTYLVSSDGTNWQDITLNIPSGMIPNSVSYLDQSFWIVGGQGMVLRSDSLDAIPHIVGSMAAQNQGFQIEITLNTPQTYRIQRRTNLLSDSWHDILVRTNDGLPAVWTDTNVWNQPSGFYRVVAP